MDNYSIEEWKLIYRVLHRNLTVHTELLEAEFFYDLQKLLQRHAQNEGIDIADHGAWDAWLGNAPASCEERVKRRTILS